MRMLRKSESLESIGGELLYTESRLLSDEHAKHLAAVMSKLIARLDLVRTGQTVVWREEVTAQAAISAADDQLDDWIRAFGRTLEDVVRGNTQSPRYKRFFPTPPWTFVRLGLENELSKVRGWAESLAAEPEQSLKDLGARLEKLVAQGDAALERRRKAGNARRDFSVRSIYPLIDEANTARAALYGDLARKGSEAALPIDWPTRFFRRTARTKDESPTEEPTTEEPTTEEPTTEGPTSPDDPTPEPTR